MEQFDKWYELRQYAQMGADYKSLGAEKNEAFASVLQKMGELDEIEKRYNPPTSSFERGDKVRHRKTKVVGTVEGKSASGKSIWFKPTAMRGSTMYPASSFELIEEETNHE